MMISSQQVLNSAAKPQTEGASELKIFESPNQDDGLLRVYYNPKPSIRICLKFNYLEFNQKSIKQLIQQSLKTLREDYLLTISNRSQLYSMYKASKTGCKKQVCEIEKKLLIKECLYKRMFLQFSNNSTSSIISTDYDLSKKSKAKKVFNFENCCFFFRDHHTI